MHDLPMVVKDLYGHRSHFGSRYHTRRQCDTQALFDQRFESAQRYFTLVLDRTLTVRSVVLNSTDRPIGQSVVRNSAWSVYGPAVKVGGRSLDRPWKVVYKRRWPL